MKVKCDWCGMDFEKYQPDNLQIFKTQPDHLNWHKENDKRYGGDPSRD